MKQDSEEEEKVPAKLLWEVEWPTCSNRCALVEVLGVGECENMCPHKFPERKD